MRVFYTNDFRGYYPVGASAVIVARNLDEAYRLMTDKLIAIGLGENNSDFTVKELSTDSTNVVVLQDGDY